MRKTLTVQLDFILIEDAWQDDLRGLRWLEIVPLREFGKIMDLMLLSEFRGLIDQRLHILKLSRCERWLNICTSSWSLSKVEELTLRLHVLVQDCGWVPAILLTPYTALILYLIALNI
jgi:hypothetical protein